jgi:predicted DNA-binding transcriptional regulator AlpA
MVEYAGSMSPEGGGEPPAEIEVHDQPAGAERSQSFANRKLDQGAGLLNAAGNTPAQGNVIAAINTPPPGTVLLTMEEVAQATGMTFPAIMRQTLAGIFPFPYRATHTSGLWDASEIERFKADRYGWDNDGDNRSENYLTFLGGMNVSDLLETLSDDEMGYPDLSTAPAEDPLDDASDDDATDGESPF